MKYDTSLRPRIAKRIEKIERADILVGIPCYNNEKTIRHVIQSISQGIHDHYKQLKTTIMISDGGSTDDTREMAMETDIFPWQEKIVSIYRGPAGKGSALRSIFETAERLSVKGCLVVDSDVRSITGDWVKFLLEPVLEHAYDFVSPIYTRYKYDGTITNNIAYNLTRALYGKRIRQPIGGDFSFSQSCARYFMDQDVWDTDIARFGIDIWMTTNAIVNGFRICQSQLGVKIHDAKDPSVHLSPMFSQVMWTLFTLMEKHEHNWKVIKGSEPTPIFGHAGRVEPEPVEVNRKNLVKKFKLGYEHFSVLWKKMFTPETFAIIKKASTYSIDKFNIDIDSWVNILYELAATFHKWRAHRYKLMQIAIPLYYGRVASFINQTIDMDSVKAEEIVELQAQAFENNKQFIIDLWDGSFEADEEFNNKLEEV